MELEVVHNVLLEHILLQLELLHQMFVQSVKQEQHHQQKELMQNQLVNSVLLVNIPHPEHQRVQLVKQVLIHQLDQKHVHNVLQERILQLKELLHLHNVLNVQQEQHHPRKEQMLNQFVNNV